MKHTPMDVIPPPAARRQGGLSLVELMVGTAIGLFIVAVACTALSGQLEDNRRLMLAMQVEQDLRAAADLIARDLRRAGYWSHAARQAAAGASNPYGDVSATAASVAYAYAQDGDDTVDGDEYTGVKLEDGTVKLLLGEGGWQPLTDPGTVTVTALRVTLTKESVDLSAYCPSPCPPGAECAPQQQLRSALIEMAGASATDARVTRTLQVRLRVRNDVVNGRCAG